MPPDPGVPRFAVRAPSLAATAASTIFLNSRFTDQVQRSVFSWVRSYPRVTLLVVVSGILPKLGSGPFRATRHMSPNQAMIVGRVRRMVATSQMPIEIGVLS